MAETIAKHTIGSSRLPEDDELSLTSRRSMMAGAHCRGALFRIALAFIFIGLGVAALVYSVSKHSTEGSDKEQNPDVLEPFRNQWNNNGTFTVEKLKNDPSSSDDAHHQEMDVTYVSTAWFQDETNKRLKHTVGIEDTADWQFTLYVLETNAYKLTGHLTTNNAVETVCQLIPDINYENYIANFGLTKLHKNSELTVKVDQKAYDVIEYDGHPPVVYNGMHSYLTFAFARHTDNTLLGWETYFAPNSSLPVDAWQLHRIRYWFGNMAAQIPDPHEFSLPSICKKSATT